MHHVTKDLECSKSNSNEKTFDHIDNRQIGQGVMGSVAVALMGSGIPVEQIQEVLDSISSDE